MNFEKNPRLARKLAKEQQHLRRVARKNPDRLTAHELSLVDWDLHLENYEEFEVEDRTDYRDERT